MTDESEIRRKNLRALGYTAKQLAETTGQNASYFYGLMNGSKSFGEKAAREIEGRLSLERGFLDATPSPRRGMAQLLSLSPLNIPSQVVWGELMSMEVLPQSFTVAMPDDSMKGSIEQGTVLIFETGLDPIPGHGVLVQDGDGRRYIRQYRKGRGDLWHAYARNESAFDSLESERDGLRVLAVMRGVMSGEL